MTLRYSEAEPVPSLVASIEVMMRLMPAMKSPIDTTKGTMVALWTSDEYEVVLVYY